EPSGSLKDTRRSAPLRATSADSVGMPIVFSPPPVSAVKTSVARYVSGSRALMPESSSGEALAFTFAGMLFVFATVFVFAFVFVFVAGRQLLATAPNATKQTRRTTGNLRRDLRIPILQESIKSATALTFGKGP